MNAAVEAPRAPAPPPVWPVTPEDVTAANAGNVLAVLAFGDREKTTEGERQVWADAVIGVLFALARHVGVDLQTPLLPAFDSGLTPSARLLVIATLRAELGAAEGEPLAAALRRVRDERAKLALSVEHLRLQVRTSHLDLDALREELDEKTAALVQAASDTTEAQLIAAEWKERALAAEAVSEARRRHNAALSAYDSVHADWRVAVARGEAGDAKATASLPRLSEARECAAAKWRETRDVLLSLGVR